MKILAVMTSPRKGGNTDTLLNKAVEGCCEAGAQVEKVVLRDCDLEMCISCHKCAEAKKCVVHPHVNEILDKIKAADGVLLATPVWWFTVSTYLKALMDHFIVFMNRDDYSCRIPHKRFAVISVCGAPADAGMSEQANEHLRNILSFMRSDYRGVVAASGVNEAGEIASDTQAMNAAFELGKKLAAQ